MKECWIFGSGAIGCYDNYKIPSGAYIIAADGGYSHLKKLGITPDFILGDFDSLTESLPDNCEIYKADVRKDDTDMMLAVKKALSMGYNDITLCGALGGRLDHTFANIQTLEYIAVHGGKGRLFSEDNIVMLQTEGHTEYRRIEGMYFSIFALTDTVVVTTRGTEYDLDEYTLTRDFPLGVSNEICGESAVCEVKSGKLLVIFSKK